MMTEVGSIYFSPEEAQRLREYLLKGRLPLGRRLLGQLRVGQLGVRVQQGAAARGIPDARSAARPSAVPHAVHRRSSAADPVDQPLGGLPATRRSAAPTAPCRTRCGVTDAKGRLLALVTYNTDIGDSWEREGDDKNYFYTFSVNGYALGINVLLYAMTH